MKRLLLFILFICVPALSHGMERSEADKLFFQAVNAYKQSQFDEAISLKEKILSGGYDSLALQYNLGNAYLKQRQPGKAILHYLRARRLAPRDADLKANLIFARNSIGNDPSFDRPQGAARIFLIHHFSAAELKWASLLFFILASVFCLFGIFQGKKSQRIFACGFVLGLVWIYFMSALVVKTMDDAGQAVVLQAGEAKFEPSSQATTYFNVFEGQELRVIRKAEGWVKVRRPDQRMGWLPATTLEAVER